MLKECLGVTNLHYDLIIVVASIPVTDSYFHGWGLSYNKAHTGRA
jgi:hypothetical protein